MTPEELAEIEARLRNSPIIRARFTDNFTGIVSKADIEFWDHAPSDIQRLLNEVKYLKELIDTKKLELVAEALEGILGVSREHACDEEYTHGYKYWQDKARAALEKIRGAE